MICDDVCIVSHTIRNVSMDMASKLLLTAYSRIIPEKYISVPEATQNLGIRKIVSASSLLVL